MRLRSCKRQSSDRERGGPTALGDNGGVRLTGPVSLTPPLSSGQLADHHLRAGRWPCSSTPPYFFRLNSVVASVIPL
jgi:hypothetical protein